jgi:hypothetical protein
MSTLPPRGPVTIWTLVTFGAFLRLSEWIKYFHAYRFSYASRIRVLHWCSVILSHLLI